MAHFFKKYQSGRGFSSLLEYNNDEESHHHHHKMIKLKEREKNLNVEELKVFIFPRAQESRK